MRVFGWRNTKQMCRSRSNSLVALIHKDNTMQPAASKRLCTPFLLFVLFTGSDCQRWSESIFKTCPCFHKKYYTSCFQTHKIYTKTSVQTQKTWKNPTCMLKYLHEHYVFHSLRYFGHLSYIKLALTKLTRYFWTLWPNLLKFIFLSFQTKI